MKTFKFEFKKVRVKDAVCHIKRKNSKIQKCAFKSYDGCCAKADVFDNIICSETEKKTGKNINYIYLQVKEK